MRISLPGILFFSQLVFFSTGLKAQLCTISGQTPETAILVCGSESFYQTTPALCGVINVPNPCPGGFSYQNLNPVFFRMNCFSSGTLGFLITPDDLQANYDWQLFDITNANPNSIFTAANMFVAANWSSEPGITGASPDGTQQYVCGGAGGNVFSAMPTVTAGRTYILMVSNQSGSTEAFELLLTGGTASITDNVEPHLLRASTGCNSNTVIVRLNKKMACSSVAPDGSDFLISGGVTVLSATPGTCNSATGSDSITLTVSPAMLAGPYTISLQQGSDGNTILDFCNRPIPAGETVPFQPAPILPTPMDSVYKINCAPRYIELVFRKPIRCSSIAPDASDFSITGPQPVLYSIGTTSCNPAGTVMIIRINFDSPLQTTGTYTVRLNTGSDGNTLLDFCGMETPAGSTVDFKVQDPVSSLFSINADPSCQETVVSFFHDGNNNTLKWDWDFGDGSFSTEKAPVKVYAQSGTYRVKLKVDNGKCVDTSSQEVTISAFLSADFTAPGAICPEDSFKVINNSSPGFDQWKWEFGNAITSDVKDPLPFKYPMYGLERNYLVRLIASHSTLGCADTVSQPLKVLGNCYIAVPTAFTPNGDGRNDYLYPLNALKADHLEFRVFNRYGQQVFYSRDWTKKWNGRISGQLQPAGVYVWLLSYTHRDTGEKVLQRGTSVLIQ